MKNKTKATKRIQESGRVPKLRFPEFRDAPEWEENNLGDIGKFTGGGTPIKDNDLYWNGNIPWVSSSDIFEDSIIEFRIAKFITEEAMQESATKRVPANSILLVSRVGVGKLAITTKPICTSQDFTNFTPTEDSLYFLAYYLKANKKVLLSFNQGTSIKGFTKDDVSNFKVFLPHINEQQKIADCLSLLEELIAAHSQKLDTLKAHKKGLMKQLFTAEGETVPKIRFPEFRDAPEWEEKRINEVCEVNPSNSALPESFVYIDLESVEAGILLKKKIINQKDAPSRAQRLLISGDVIFQMVRPYQKNNYFFQIKDDLKYVASTGYAQLRAFQNSAFLFQYLHIDRFVDKVLSNCTGSNYPAINSNALCEITIEIPDTPEQQKIAGCLSSLDELIAAQAQKVSSLKAHKKGLMQQLFPSADEGN